MYYTLVDFHVSKDRTVVPNDTSVQNWFLLTCSSTLNWFLTTLVLRLAPNLPVVSQLRSDQKYHTVVTVAASIQMLSVALNAGLLKWMCGPHEDSDILFGPEGSVGLSSLHLCTTSSV